MATTDPESRIAALVRSGQARITDEFYAALVIVRNSVNLTELAGLLETGRFDEAFRVVSSAAARLGVTWADVYTVAGSQTGNWMTRDVGDIVIAFDQTHDRAVRIMRDNQLRLVREFTNQQSAATRQALVRGIQDGLNPIEQARAFRDSIGLTANQERWVENYRRSLSTLDRSALDRALRDRRFDPTVERAIEEGRPLTRAQIDRMVERYRERAIRYRSEVIARTESLKATHAGVREMYDQAIESGQLDPNQLVRIWNTAGDERVREMPGDQTSHARMHNQERRWGEPFTSGAGNQAFDPGTFGVAYEDIQCRCVVSTRILTPEEAGIFSAQIINT